jgi:hypothetical protein
MRFNVMAAVGILALMVPLAGCQTPEESATNAEMTCRSQGLRPGSARFERCVGATYAGNRRQSQQAENAAVAGVAAGVIGGALVGAAVSNHHHSHYRRCYGYRCW